MRLEEYKTMYRVEDGMWWYIGMRAITRAIMERHCLCGGERLRILDAGCGTGANMSLLRDYGRVAGIDLIPLALTLSRKRGHTRLAGASVTALPFATASFDVVASLDVLPMLPPALEAHAFREMARLIVPGGRLLLRAAAYDWLRGAHDRHWDVQHRYAPGELCAKLERAGLRVEHLTFANMWLFPLAALKRLSEPLFPKQEQSDLALGAGPLNTIMAAILSSEAGPASRGRLPFGLSLIAVARKPEDETPNSFLIDASARG